ncbi:outer membrane protein assembly factor BamE domain-containing protein, partial [Caballeronia glebae]
MFESKTWGVVALISVLVSVLIGLSGCSAFVKDPDPREYMSRVKIGMTRADVEDHLGPPDGNWGPWHSQCTEYAFNSHGGDRYSVYYNNQSRVVYT